MREKGNMMEKPSRDNNTQHESIRGKPLSEEEWRRIVADSSATLVRPQDLKRYDRVAHGEKGRRFPDVVLHEAFRLDGASQEHNVDLAQIQEKVERHLDMPVFTYNGITGTENAILLDNPDPDEATKIIKVPFHPRSQKDSKQRALVHNFYALIAPENIPPAEEFWVDKEVSGIIVPKVTKHPQLEEAKKYARNGDPDMLNSLIKRPTRKLLEACEKYGIPFDIDPMMRNFIVDPQGTEWYIDEIRIEPKDLIAAMTQYHVVVDMVGNPQSEFYPNRREIIRTIRELEDLERTKKKSDLPIASEVFSADTSFKNK